jgi:hypothetical protein
MDCQRCRLGTRAETPAGSWGRGGRDRYSRGNQRWGGCQRWGLTAIGPIRLGNSPSIQARAFASAPVTACGPREWQGRVDLPVASALGLELHPRNPQPRAALHETKRGASPPPTERARAGREQSGSSARYPTRHGCESQTMRLASPRPTVTDPPPADRSPPWRGRG